MRTANAAATAVVVTETETAAEVALIAAAGVEI